MERNVIGITGGIGSGKSVVSRLLRLNGIKVYDCDTEAKRLMEQDPALRAILTDILGEEAYEGDRIDRKYVAARIFSDSLLRERVNSAVHAAVRENIQASAPADGTPYFIESAILATGGIIPLVEEVWAVEASEELRIRRVELRNHISREEVKKRIESQRTELSMIPERMIRVILNNGNDLLLLQVRNLMARFPQNPFDKPSTDYEIEII